ncbi:AbiH family protein [Flagellimonas sp.]|uniref:AbiH family protein n=1 Tax=Flagellimonas sp. TaxID=2058762 RepID=UPI003BA8A065
MNRIILIGNGFDRSLNLPTGYSHFLDWIFRDTLKFIIDNVPIGNFYGGRDYSSENDLFSFQINGHTLVWVKSLFDDNRDYKYYSEERKRIETQQYFNFTLRPHHPFISLLFDVYDSKGWVDIEQLYFNTLLRVKSEGIDDFNHIFSIVRGRLSKYLEGLHNQKNDAETLDKYRRHFFGSTLKYNPRFQSYEESKAKPKSYYFVNFNYTWFLRYLLDYAPKDVENDIIINNIHGEIKNYPIIFGYGNETGEEYSRLENLGNEFLENIKSTHYFNSTHYRDLERQLGEPYEVYVYGLSCGLSDNILLKTIMQRPNCQQIRIFYHKESNGDNFRSTLMNISRVFDNKEEMRSKIISKQENDFIPQVD